MKKLLFILLTVLSFNSFSQSNIIGDFTVAGIDSSTIFLMQKGGANPKYYSLPIDSLIAYIGRDTTLLSGDTVTLSTIGGVGGLIELIDSVVGVAAVFDLHLQSRAR